ncbi:MAG: MFS transporter [Candidatus Hydrogenedentes bacterium]|nr:MFS transporter [Candidatus Hydrogenedentota bacterium]
MSMATGVHDSIFNNFLSDTFHMSAESRGYLEFPRETPGFLTVLLTGILSALPVTRMGVTGTLLFGVGMIGIATMGGSYWPMMAMMVIGSAGMHLLQPVGSSVALALSDAANRGRRMGQAGMVSTVGTVLGTGLVLLVLSRFSAQYQIGFACAAALGVAAAVIYGFMHIPDLHQPRTRPTLKKKFSLYYLLEFFFGARKQIFITFGPWVLIKVYGVDTGRMAGLLLIAALIGIAFQPILGAIIDRFGERSVMIADGLLLSVVCIGYGFAAWWMGSTERALPIACGCYIADNLLFALGSARAVYLSRLTSSHDELTSTLAMGVSINHIASMTIPAVAGMIWFHFGYERVFAVAALLALALAALGTRTPSKWQHDAAGV